MSKNPQELIQERIARQMAAINLEIPDKVPTGAVLFALGGDFVADYSGLTQAEFAHDYEKALRAIQKYNEDFPFDVAGGALMGLDGQAFGLAFLGDELAPSTAFISGPIHKALGPNGYFKFPGNEISDNSAPQFLGGTFMEPEEYDLLAKDPVKFIAETILPRVIEGLDTPKNAMATWTRFGVEVQRFQDINIKIVMSNAQQGFGFIPFGITHNPMDVIADFLRGITNTVLDTRRHPERLKAACQAMVDPMVEFALTYKKMGAEFVFIPLHMNEYLSPKLYKEFYWPTLKEIIIRLYEKGMRSLVFFEGHHEPHLETILDLPRGWGVAYFEKTDIVMAKEVLKNNCCVAGGLPIGLVVGGTPESIDAHIKDLFEKVKPGGGFILLPSIGAAPAGTPPQNIRAVIDAVEKYGYY